MLDLDFYECKADHRLVSVADVDYVNGLVNRFLHSGDPEERNIGLIAAAILERLGLKENAPGAATPKGGKKYNITALL